MAAEQAEQDARNNEGHGGGVGPQSGDATLVPVPIEVDPAISAKRDALARAAGASTGEELSPINKKPKLELAEDGADGID